MERWPKKTIHLVVEWGRIIKEKPQVRGLHYSTTIAVEITRDLWIHASPTKASLAVQIRTEWQISHAKNASLEFTSSE